MARDIFIVSRLQRLAYHRQSMALTGMRRNNRSGESISGAAAWRKQNGEMAAWRRKAAKNNNRK